MHTNKRRDDSIVNTPAKKPRKACSYGDNCYRRNPAHLREFSHAHLESILENYSGTGEFPIPENLIIQKQLIEEQLQIIIDKNIYQSQNINNTAPDKAATSKNEQNSAEPGPTKTTETSINDRVSSARENDPLKFAMSNSGSGPKGIENMGSTEVKPSNLVTESSKMLPQATLNTGSSSSKESVSDYRPVVEPTKRIEEFFKVVLPRGRMAEKHRRSAPYHVFYTTIAASPATHTQPNSITFQEILDRSLGELKCSLQINFMVDVGWLLAHYYFAGYSRKRLTILYGEDTPDIATVGRKQPHVDAHRIDMATPFGKHHTKLMLLCYEDGSLRVVVSTANLYHDDWENRTQGLWMSPACPPLPEGAMPHAGDSPTGFKSSLLGYLEHYRLPALARHVELVRRSDMSALNVFLVASVPGGHRDSAWGMSRMGALLQQECRVPPARAHAWHLLAQASSIGSYGKQPALWLTGDFLSKFCRLRNQSPLLSSTPPQLKLIYPSLENVQQSHDGLLGGGCLPYSGTVHAKQPWLKQFLHQWRAKDSCRDRAMPHIKSYLRVSPDYKMAAFYLLTSANISKAAWGVVNKGNAALRIMNYEVGVLFLPQYVINEDFFPLDRREGGCLPLAYDLPPIPYTDSMGPWVMDYLQD